MAGLSDMEELLARISNKDIVDYMREALSCYHAGATRGCIVLCYLALFDDLRQKLRQLAQINSTAKTISAEVELRASSQEIFETHMASRLKAEGLITEADSDLLEQVRIRRNKAAHPSGIHASPEEARFVYFEVIDKFLSKQVLKTTHAVDALIERLSHSNLFPSENIGEIEAIARHEVADVHREASTQLMIKCAAKWDDVNKTVVRNARYLLLGLSYGKRGTEDKECQKYVVEPISNKLDHAKSISMLLAANPALLKGLNDAVRFRIQALLSKVLQDTDLSISVAKMSHPVKLLANLLKTLGAEFVSQNYETWADAVIEKYPYTPSLIRALEPYPTLTEKILNLYIREARSSDFETANRFARNISDIEELLLTSISPENAFKILVAVNHAAEHGAWSSKDLRATRYISTPNIREKAIAFIKSGSPKLLLEILSKENFYEAPEVFLKTLEKPNDEVDT